MKLRKNKRLSRSRIGDALVFLMLAFFGVFMALPIVYSVLNAFKPLEEIFIFPPRFYVSNPTLENFGMLSKLTENLWVPLSRYIFNSVFISLTATVLHVLCASMAAYTLEKSNFPGKDFFFWLITTALLFTGGTLGLPQYIVMAKLHMVNTYSALILPAIAGSLGMFLMKQFMVGIPNAMLEAARIDGAGEFRIFWRLVMPNVKPAWLTIAIFAFQGVWNAAAGNIVYSEELKTLPQILQQIQAGGIARMGVASAAALIIMLPPVIFFIFCQGSIMQTMSHSGMKD